MKAEYDVASKKIVIELSSNDEAVLLDDLAIDIAEWAGGLFDQIIRQKRRQIADKERALLQLDPAIDAIPKDDEMLAIRHIARQGYQNARARAEKNGAGKPLKKELLTNI